MYFDFEESRPETPRVARAFSVREGILVSIIVHLCFLILILVFPDLLSPSEDAQQLAELEQARDRPPLKFVEVLPLVDRPDTPIRPADQSDMDRRSATIERAPAPENTAPRMEGNTPEPVVGGPRTPPPGGTPAPPSPSPDSMPLEEGKLAYATPVPPAPAAAPPSRDLSDSLRNLGQYLRGDRFNNPQGGQTDRESDFQFDSMGVDFGPWLLRFKYQVERNWLVPQAAMMHKGRVVVRFTVLRNGTITDVTVLQPGPIPAMTSAALNALKLSNPTSALPADYPADRMVITATFHYNDRDYQ